MEAERPDDGRWCFHCGKVKADDCFSVRDSLCDDCWDNREDVKQGETMTDEMEWPDRIYLEPEPLRFEDEGRMWCEDQIEDDWEEYRRVNTLASDPEAKRAIMGEPVGYMVQTLKPSGVWGAAYNPFHFRLDYAEREVGWCEEHGQEARIVPLYAITEETSEDGE